MAAVAFGCSMCGKEFRVIPEQGGRRVRCPHCEAPNSVPTSVFAPVTPHDDNTEEPSALAGSLHDLATSVDTFAKANEPSKFSSGFSAPPRLRYTHSQFARVTCILSQVLFSLAVAVLLYVSIVAPWDLLASMPLKEAVPSVALILMPSTMIALTALFLMIASQSIEYLARISAK